MLIFVPIHSVGVEIFHEIGKTWMSVSYFVATYLLVVWIQKAKNFNLPVH